MVATAHQPRGSILGLLGRVGKVAKCSDWPSSPFGPHSLEQVIGSVKHDPNNKIVKADFVHFFIFSKGSINVLLIFFLEINHKISCKADS